MNTHLNAKNEEAVMALVNGDAKGEFNALVAQKHKLAVSTVKAAAYYW
jgi:hypothetical protein